jgi:subtilisin-like proprotein convertase family protein
VKHRELSQNHELYSSGCVDSFLLNIFINSIIVLLNSEMKMMKRLLFTKNINTNNQNESILENISISIECAVQVSSTRALSRGKLSFLPSFFLILISLFGILGNVWGQCTNCNSNYPTGTFSTTSSTWTNVAANIYGGEYAYYNVSIGSTYQWQTCGVASYDTQLTLRQGSNCSGTYLGYSDDACGTQSQITWTATFTGTVTVLLSQYNCSNNTTNTTVQWRCSNYVPPCTAPTLGTLTNGTARDFCNSSGNYGSGGANISVPTVSGQSGTVVWDWGSNNGVWNNNWVTAAAAGTCCFPKKVGTSNGDADRIRYRVTNACGEVTSSTILINNYYNDAPTSLGASENNFCSTDGGTINLTATFPSSINMRGTVKFYSGSCGGTLLGSVTPSAGSSTATLNIAKPTSTTTYFARYETGVYTGCSNTACSQVTVTVVQASGNPSVYGSNVWNVYCYNGNNFENYRGFYTENNLSFGTYNRWSQTGNPTTANTNSGSAYSGCSLNNDNHSYIYKRQGFTPGLYSIDVNRDDEYILLIDGSQVATGGCCGWAYGVWSGQLTASSTVEIRLREYTGDSYLGANINLQCTFPTAPGFGSNTWNVLGYRHSGYNFANLSTLSNHTYYGYYTNSTVDIVSTNQWCNECSPSNASGWTGCTLGSDNHTVVYKRQGFPSAAYQIDLNGHDDGVQCYVNGVLVYQIDGCCADRGVIWSGMLCGTSTVEFRVMEGGGGSNLSVDFIETVVTANAGSDATICAGNSTQLNGSANTFLGVLTSTSNNTSGAISDYVNLDRTISISGTNANAIDLSSVSLNLTHTWDSDLSITLIAPNGSFIDLSSNNGGSGDNYTNTVFSTSGGAITSGSAPFTGTFSPEQPFSNLTGSADGIWTLRIYDGASGDGGTLSNWTLSIPNRITPSYSWSPGSGLSATNVANPTATPAATTNYTLSATNNGCSVTDDVLVTVNTLSTAPSISGTSTICTGASTTLTASGGTNGTGATVNWYSGPNGTGTFLGTGNSISVSPVSSTTIYARREGTCNSTTDALINITVNPTSVAGSVSANQTICAGTTPANITLTGNTGTIQWQVSTDNSTFSNIVGATASPLTSAQLGALSSTRYYRAMVTSGVCVSAYSSSVAVIVSSSPTTANAGPDQTGSSTCGLTSVTLAGNTPTVGTGAWSIISGTGGSVTTVSSATSAFSGTAGSTYTLRWTVSNSPCAASTDDVMITFNRNPTTANAGADQTGAGTCGLTSVTLAGNAPTVGTGAWSIISGTGGTVTTASSATSTFTGTAGSTYTLRWTISNSPCTTSTDDLVITFNQNPTTANAGPDQTSSSTCGLTSVTLAGNAPTVGTGAWSIISGTGGSVTTASSATSTFSGTAGSTYTLRWTISNSPCTASTDDVVITFNQNPTTANAGADQTGSSTCGLTSVTLAGNTPTVGTGAWSIISGTGGSVTTASSATSTFSGTAGSTYTLRWTVSNSPCTASTDDVIVTFGALPTAANAGSDQSGANTCGRSIVTLAGNAPTGLESGVWDVISASGQAPGTGVVNSVSEYNSTFTGVPGATYTLRWTLTKGACTAYDDVSITLTQPTTPDYTPSNGDLLWGGLTDNGWSTSSNWYQYNASQVVNNVQTSAWERLTTGEPSGTSKVMIMQGDGTCRHSTNMPSLSLSETVNNLTVSTGATLNLSNGSMSVKGDVINYGTINPGTGTLSFDATSGNQTIGGTQAILLNNLTLDKQAGDLNITTPIIVKGTLNMARGNINNSAILTVGENSSTTGSIQHANGTILGQLRRYFDADATPGSGYYFPVGNTSNTRGATIDFTSSPGSNQYLTVQYVSGYAGGATPLYTGLPLTTADGVLIQNFDNEGYWEINPTADNYNSSINSAPYSISLQMKNLTGVNDRSTVRIIKAAGSSTPAQHHNTWSALTFGATPVTGTSNTDFSVTGTSTGFSWFGAGSGNNNPLPVELLSFTGLCDEGIINLTWQTASEFNSSHFDVEKSRDGENWQLLTTLPSAGTSNELITYQSTDQNGTEGNNYFRLRQVDIDGTEKLYDPINVSCSEVTTGYFSSFPNPSGTSFQVVVNNKELIGACTLNMVDASGKVIEQRTIDVKEGINLFVINQELNPGIYFLNITNGAKSTQILRHAVK